MSILLTFAEVTWSNGVHRTLGTVFFSRVFALLLCYSLALQGVLTPYACGPSPVYYASGYISRRHFWLLGFIFGLVFITTLLVIGIPWLTFING
jgi:di/tricarboxylate transporter